MIVVFTNVKSIITSPFLFYRSPLFPVSHIIPNFIGGLQDGERKKVIVYNSLKKNANVFRGLTLSLVYAFPTV